MKHQSNSHEFDKFVVKQINAVEYEYNQANWTRIESALEGYYNSQIRPENKTSFTPLTDYLLTLLFGLILTLGILYYHRSPPPDDYGSKSEVEESTVEKSEPDQGVYHVEIQNVVKEKDFKPYKVTPQQHIVVQKLPIVQLRLIQKENQQKDVPSSSLLLPVLKNIPLHVISDTNQSTKTKKHLAW